MPSRLLPPRYAAWPRWSALAAALLGLAVGLYLDWYFVRGPGAANPDRGEAHGLIAMVLGFPFSLLPFNLLGAYAGRAGLVLSIGTAGAFVGALLGTIVALVVARIRDEDSRSSSAG